MQLIIAQAEIVKHDNHLCSWSMTTTNHCSHPFLFLFGNWNRLLVEKFGESCLSELPTSTLHWMMYLLPTLHLVVSSQLQLKQNKLLLRRLSVLSLWWRGQSRTSAVQSSEHRSTPLPAPPPFLLPPTQSIVLFAVKHFSPAIRFKEHVSIGSTSIRKKPWRMLASMLPSWAAGFATLL